MGETKPPAIVDLVWTGDLAFAASDSTHAWVLDGNNLKGPSPVVALAAALAGCMSIDLVDILAKGRHAVRGVKAHLVGHRADTAPRRFTQVELTYVLDTDAPADAIQRAIDLSREKYCSVWHSMRQDIGLAVSYTVGDRG